MWNSEELNGMHGYSTHKFCCFMLRHFAVKYIVVSSQVDNPLTVFVNSALSTR